MQYYQNPYAYRKPSNTTQKVAFTHTAEDVWAAAWQAFVTNGNQYVKAIAPDIPGHRTNRMIVDSLLSDPTQITQESREQGEIVRRYYKGLTFKVIEGKAISEFNDTAMKIADKDLIQTNYDLAVLTSLPASYEKNAKRDDVERKIKFACGGYVGTIGDKVTTNIEVIKRVWSQKWNTWFITGMTDKDQVLFFSYKKDIEVGVHVKIQGTVKGTRDGSTQLNRVKVI